jgi:hypothetical protein
LHQRSEIEELKNGNQVIGVIFHISPNKKTPRIALNDAEYIDSEDMLDLLGRFEINKKTATELINNFGEKHIRKNIKYVYEKQRNAEIGSISGYIIKSIKENYAEVGTEYAPDDEFKRSTSISQMNKRINDLINFYELCVRDKVKTQSEADRDLLQATIVEINNTADRRIRLNMRPLQESDFTDLYGKKAFIYHS